VSRSVVNLKKINIGLIITLVLSLTMIVGSIGVGAFTFEPETKLTEQPKAVLTSGVPYTSSLSGTGATQTHTIVVTSGATKMYSVLTCGSVDFDLYGHLGSAPTTSHYDWRGYTSGGEEVTFNNPGAGTWYIMVRSYSGSGSYTLTVTITYGTSDTTAPTVSITAPTNGATVSGTTTISATASDNVGVTSVGFYIDSSLVSTDTASPYSYSWITTGYTDGSHSIYAKAYDAAGNVGTSSTVTVTVSNGGGGYTQLTSGVPVTGSLTSSSDTDVYTITVAANCQSMYSVLTCDTVDFDLYGKLGSVPTTSSYAWRGYTSGGEEVTYASPGAGTWYIMVDQYSGTGSYQLTVTLTYGGGGGWGTGGKYAVIVGISDYASISDLSYCDEDATDWYNKLYAMGYECHVYGDGHTANYPRHDGYATEANVRAAIQSLYSVAVSGNTVCFITSGHGSGDGAGESYLCMYDCSGSTGCYYDHEVADDLDGFATGVKIFVFIDHCFSGGIGPELMAMSNSLYVFCTTTCTANGYGYDDSSHLNGAWTYYYLQYTWINYYGGGSAIAHETIFTYADSVYPYTGGDNPMKFDGNTGSSFYL